MGTPARLLTHVRGLRINVMSLNENMVLRAKDADCPGGDGCTLVVKWRLAAAVAGTCPTATQQLALQLALINWRSGALTLTKPLSPSMKKTVYTISHAKAHVKVPVPDYDNDIFHSLHSSEFIGGSERRKRENRFRNAAACI
jgi:hypothetical protein